MNNKKSINFLLLASASAVLAGCSLMDPWTGGDKINSTEDLLAAEGTWHLVEQEPTINPLEKHAMIRREVQPDSMASGRYTEQYNPHVANVDVHSRLLLMEREIRNLRRDMDQLLPPLANLILSNPTLDPALGEAVADIKERAKTSTINPSFTVTGAEARLHPVTAPGMEETHHQKMEKAAPEPADMMKPQFKDNKMAAPKAEDKPMKKAKALKPVKSSGPVVKRVRLGQHPGKTRVVLDLGQKGSFSYDVDNNEKLLLVDLPGLSWSARASERYKKDPIIAGYSAQSNGSGGTLLAIELRKAARVVSSGALEPNKINKNHRIMIDVAKL